VDTEPLVGMSLLERYSLLQETEGSTAYRRRSRVSPGKWRADERLAHTPDPQHTRSVCTVGRGGAP
jgi:hypothetical protein